MNQSCTGGHYQADMAARTGAARLTHPAPCASCFASGCRSASLEAADGRFKSTSDHDRLGAAGMAPDVLTVRVTPAEPCLEEFAS